MPAVSDDFSRADGADLGPGEWVELTGEGWAYAPSRQALIRETCATIQQVALTIAIPVFGGLGALLLAGITRAVWTF